MRIATAMQANARSGAIVAMRIGFGTSRIFSDSDIKSLTNNPVFEYSY
jgi:hypothetical protein